MANILLDVLPETVEIDGMEYLINSDFRISILFELLVQDDTIGKRQKLIQGLKLYYPQIPSNTSEAVEKMIWFYRCGRVPDGGREIREDDDGNSLEKPYSFEYDDAYIYAAFMEQYGIDLQDEDIHWWKFRALFNSLSEDTEFAKIMGYRSIDITSKMSNEQKRFYKKKKAIYALPRPEAEREAQELLEEALMNGGDISDLV